MPDKEPIPKPDLKAAVKTASRLINEHPEAGDVDAKVDKPGPNRGNIATPVQGRPGVLPEGWIDLSTVTDTEAEATIKELWLKVSPDRRKQLRTKGLLEIESEEFRAFIMEGRVGMPDQRYMEWWCKEKADSEFEGHSLGFVGNALQWARNETKIDFWVRSSKTGGLMACRVGTSHQAEANGGGEFFEFIPVGAKRACMCSAKWPEGVEVRSQSKRTAKPEAAL